MSPRRGDNNPNCFAVDSWWCRAQPHLWGVPAAGWDPPGIIWGKFGAGVVSWSSALPARPPPRCVSAERRARLPWRNKCNTSLGFSEPQLPGPARRLLPAASSRRVLWIYFCRYKYNVRMGRSITNNIHDTAVNGARYKVWLPGALAHAGKDDFPVSSLLIPEPWFQAIRRGEGEVWIVWGSALLAGWDSGLAQR